MIKRLILILFLIPNFTNASIIINEIAWMGTVNSANDEWIELRNTDGNEINISSWILEWKNGESKITFSEKCPNAKISASGYSLLERTDDTTVPNIAADCIYTGALSNSGEKLVLKDGGGNIIDTVDASGGWLFGDNATKQTMQKSDSGWITADATPRAQNASSQSTSTSTSDVDATEPTPGVGSSSWPVEPQIFANAGPDKTAVVGADVYFSGQALGIKKEPLENARYLWNLGDGAIAENQNVKHIYMYPGEYIAVLDVSSGQYSASDNLLVKVIPNQLKISEANQDFIKIANESSVTLDLSGWFLKLKGNSIFFKFPASTLIKANSILTIPYSNSGIQVGDSNVVEILYPNASLAVSWQKIAQQILPQETVIPKEASQKPVEIQEEMIEVGGANVANVDNVASVMVVEEKNFLNSKMFIFLVIGLGIISAAGLLFIRHKYKYEKN